MPQADSHLSLKELLAHAKTAGHLVRRDQVIRWHKAGLVPRPARQWLGQGQGSRSLGYPAEALNHVIAISRLLRVRSDLNWVGWVLWLAGYPVTPAIRIQLQRVADHYAAELRQALTNLETDEPDLSGRDVFRRLGARDALRSLGLMPGRFRGRKAGEFETALYLILRVLAGFSVGERELDEAQVLALEQTLLGARHVSEVDKTVIRDHHAAETPRRQPTRSPGQRKLEEARRAKAAMWRDTLRRQVSALSEEVGASLITSGLPFVEDAELERWREECIAVWLLVNADTPGFAPPMGPPREIFLLWYVFRGTTTVGSRTFAFLDTDARYALECRAVERYRLLLEHWGLPLPLRGDRRATLLPMTLKEHPDAHLICHPIETGKRRPRGQRVRATPRR